MLDKFVTVDEVSESLKIPIQTIRIWLRKGYLKGIRFGRHWRIKEMDLQSFIKNHEEQSSLDNRFLKEKVVN